MAEDIGKSLRTQTNLQDEFAECEGYGTRASNSRR